MHLVIVQPLISHRSLVIVHGLCKTPWAAERIPQTGCRDSTAWLFQNAGFQGWQYLSFMYDVAGTDLVEPAVFYRDGIEAEATKLLRGLVAHRKSIVDKYGEEEVRLPVFC